MRLMHLSEQWTRRTRRCIISIAAACCALWVAVLSAQPATAPGAGDDSKRRPATSPAPATNAGLPHVSFQIAGRIEAPAIRESSGIVASRAYPGIFWTHNDSGNGSAIYAIERDGKLVSQFAVAVPHLDWEDIAIDERGNLYLADIGNNLRNRWQVQIRVVPEPDPRGKDHGPLRPTGLLRVTYPGEQFDAEGFFVHAGSGYIVSKHLDGSAAGIYRFGIEEAAIRPVTMEKVASLAIRLPATAADISTDGSRMAVMTVAGPFVYRIDGDPARAAVLAPWYGLFLDPGAEAVCFTDGGLLATTEGRRMVFFPLPEDSR